MATSWRSKKNHPLGVGTLNTAIDDNDLTIVLDAGQGASFPASNFTISIDEEIILIDSRSTDTLTVNASGRGYDSSTASAHAAGVAIANYQIVKDFTDLETAVNTIESKIDGTNALALDGVYLKYGTDSDIKFGYDEATNDRGEWRDPSDNVLAYLKDLGTTGLFGVTGHIECPQIGISADTDLIQLASGALSVNGTLDVLGHGAFGSSGAVTSTELLQVHESSTLTSGTLRWVYGRCIPAAASSASTLYTAIFGEIPYATAQSYTATLSAAVEGRMTMGNVAATVARAHGVMSTINRGTANPGTFTDYRAFFSQAINSSSEITTAYGIYLNELGAATAEYGLYIADLNNATTNYAIYTNAGTVRFGGRLIIADTASPASNATGTPGMITWDASYIYVCTATDTWERAALTGGY